MRGNRDSNIRIGKRPRQYQYIFVFTQIKSLLEFRVQVGVFIQVYINDHRGSQTSYAADRFHGEIEPKLSEVDQ